MLICSKGVEEGTGMLPVEVFRSVLGSATRTAVLSGPNHAEEVVRAQPSATVIASDDEPTAVFFRDLLASETFRTYTSDDPHGVELCAAFKNVIAIAVGVSYGLGFGDNTASLLITRGLAEMSRMTVACGGQALTCMGLAGAGDMVATCMSRHSRNRRFGQDFVALGKSLDDFEREFHMVVEGALACKTLACLADRTGVELPLTDTVRSIVWGGRGRARGGEGPCVSSSEIGVLRYLASSGCVCGYVPRSRMGVSRRLFPNLREERGFIDEAADATRSLRVCSPSGAVAFELEQRDPQARIGVASRDAAVRVHHAMSRHDDGERVLADGRTHHAVGARRSYGARDVLVRAGLTVGNVADGFPNRTLESGSIGLDGDVEGGPFPAKYSMSSLAHRFASFVGLRCPSSAACPSTTATTRPSRTPMVKGPCGVG